MDQYMQDRVAQLKFSSMCPTKRKVCQEESPQLNTPIIVLCIVDIFISPLNKFTYMTQKSMQVWILSCKDNKGHSTKIEEKILHLLHNSLFFSSLEEEARKEGGRRMRESKRKVKISFLTEAFELRVSLELQRRKTLWMELEIGALTSTGLDLE